MASLFFSSRIARKRLLSIVLASAALAGCTSAKPSLTSTGSDDYRVNHPLKVGRERVSMTLDIPAPGHGATPGEDQRFMGFLRDYIARGHGAVVVETSDPQTAREILRTRGLRDREMTFIENKTDGRTMVLSFSANRVIAPKCGDWSGPSGYTPENKIHPNFGCAFQRDIGLMVSDPGDLVRAQPMAPRPAASSDLAIENYINRVNAPNTGAGTSAGAAPQSGAGTPASTPTSSTPTSSTPAK